MQELSRLVRQAFGERLEHATPSNVREFLDGLQKADWESARAQLGSAGALDLTPADSDAALRSWETEVRRFFRHALDQPPDVSSAALWLFALEMAYSGIEEISAARLGRLFDE